MLSETMNDFGTDAKLVKLAQAGNRQAYAILSRRSGTRLFQFLRKVLGDEEDARDVCQDALIKAWLNITKLKDPLRFKPWLHSIALNLCRDCGRKKLVTVSIDVERDEGGFEPVSTAATPLEEAENADLSGILGRALSKLPSDQRIAILLYEIQGFSSQEISSIVGAPAATVRSRIFYGLKSLRGLVSAEGITRDHCTHQEGSRHG